MSIAGSATDGVDFSLPEVERISVVAELDDELIDLHERDREFVEKLDDIVGSLLHYVADGEPEDPNGAVRDMAAAKVFASYIPEQFGGEGANSYSTMLCRIRETLGYSSGPLDTLFGRQGVGSCAIVMMGSDEQRQRFLPELLAGTKLFAFALTEPDAGSDVLGMKTQAERVDGGYVLNGTKAFISGADDADMIIVFARTDEGRRGASISGFIVERGTPGFSTEPMPESTAPHGIGTVTLRDCFVPAANLIGEEGRGLHGALGTLEVYRASIGGMASGMAHRAFDLALAYARRRQAFGAPLLELEATRGKLARMWTEIAMARVLVYRAAALRDSGAPSLREAGMAKLFGTESAQRVVYDSQQIHGGRGVLIGTEVELQFRELRPATIYEGSSEVQRTIIARAEIANPQPPVAAGAPDLPAPADLAEWVREGTGVEQSSFQALVEGLQMRAEEDPAEARDALSGLIASVAAEAGEESPDAAGETSPRFRALVQLATAATRVGAVRLRYHGVRAQLADPDGPHAALAKRQWVQLAVADCATTIDSASLLVPYAGRVLGVGGRFGLALAAAAELASSRAAEESERFARDLGIAGAVDSAGPPPCIAGETELQMADVLLEALR